MTNLRAYDPAMLQLNGQALSSEAISAINDAEKDPLQLRLPGRDLGRKVYGEVKKALELINGKWMVGKGYFAFTYDYRPLLNKILEAGCLPKRNPGALFPTPISICENEIEYLDDKSWGRAEQILRVLDPSGGTGNWLQAARSKLDQKAKYGLETIAIELDAVNCGELASQGHQVYQGNFLDKAITPDLIGGLVDLVLINPPFNGRDWLKHINKVRQFLHPDGAIVMVYPVEPSTKKWAAEFRQFIAENGGIVEYQSAEETGFPVDCHVANVRLSSEATKVGQWNPQNGYPSWHCHEAMILLDAEPALQRPGYSPETLDEIVLRLWSEGTALYWDEIVRSQCLNVLNEFFRTEASLGNTYESREPMPDVPPVTKAQQLALL